MPRVSGFRGTYQPNKRPYLSLTPDAYVSIQGETSVVACGECMRKLDLNKYLTGLSVEASVDSAPGSATVNLSIPDNDVNEFYADGNFVIIDMMEIELFGKGYYTVGGFPQYYRIFWGLISSVTRSWSNGVTTVTLSCRDILRWWELTNINKNPAFLDASKSLSGYQLLQNRFSGLNPYTVILTLAKEAMGDTSLTTGSFTSFRPEDGPEGPVIGQYAKDIMTYWQLKFSNIWNNLVLYGTSGQAYTFTGDAGNVSPLKISEQIFAQEDQNLNLNPESSLFKTQPHEIAAFKVDVPRAGDVDFFQSEIQSKLSIAFIARDQIGYEFYCDTTGDIVFKPPFYNLNVIPNKPVSWIYDFEIIDDSLTESEQEVFTHVVSSGNAFGGVTDWGLNDDITTPRTGVVDWHLLKRYGWRMLTMQVEWAGNPRKLFYHLLDYIDRVNSKRHSGNITIPMRPELRMGFPVWIPRFDAFYYVQGLSHNFSPGGQATTVLSLTAKRSKFIAPKNIGKIEFSRSKSQNYKDKAGKTFTQEENAYNISFPSNVGQTSGLTALGQEGETGGPAILRDPRTGKQLGFPNAVMVYRTALNQEVLSRILQQQGSTKSNKPTKQDKKSVTGSGTAYQQEANDILTSLQGDKKAETIDRLRLHRYEAGMTNAGAYDYAHDVDGIFKEFSVIPADKISWATDSGQESGAETKEVQQKNIADKVNSLNAQRPDLVKAQQAAYKALSTAKKDFNSYLKTKYKNSPPKANQYDAEDLAKQELVVAATTEYARTAKAITDLDSQIKEAKVQGSSFKALTSINVMVRPVSDEFGFEVVGHYRYGRGVFIDRGLVQLPDPNSVDANPNVVNKIGIQFAAQGGLLTDNPTLVNLGPNSTDFAAEYERLQPEDYVTGASFSGSSYNSDSKLDDVNPTGQQTYSSSIDNAVTRNGKAVFAEADALRRAQTLAELKPTSPNGLDDVGFEKCACHLGRSEWLSVLPQTFINEILKPTSSTAVNNDDTVTTDGVGGVSVTEGEAVPSRPTTPPAARFGSPDAEIEVALQSVQSLGVTSDLATDAPAASNVTTAQGDNFVLEGPGGFFDVLRKYLTERFDRDYQDNTWREKYAISGGHDVVRTDERPDDNNILAPPSDALFTAASQGDPDALRALAQGANFNFGNSSKALDNFSRDAAEANAKMRASLTGTVPPGSNKPVFSVTTSSTGPSKQQFQPPASVLKLPAVANPSGYPNFGSGTRGDAGTSVGPGDSQTRI